MTFLKTGWTKALEVGQPDIDEQHQMLFQMAYDLEEQMGANKFRQGALDALQGMRIYASTHFAFEEALMAQDGFSDLNRHKGLHAEFLLEVGQFEKAVRQSGEWGSLEVLTYLVNWLTGHIQREDTKFFRPSQTG